MNLQSGKKSFKHFLVGGLVDIIKLLAQELKVKMPKFSVNVICKTYSYNKILTNLTSLN